MAAGRSRPVRIALEATGEAGNRAGRVLLAESELSQIGLIGRQPLPGRDDRVVAVGDLADWDVMVSDAGGGLVERVRQAETAGIPLVLAGRLRRRRRPPAVPVVENAIFSGVIAQALLERELERLASPQRVTVAVTTHGKPRSKGLPAHFPDPVGSRWADEVDTPWRTTPAPMHYLEAPIDDPIWAGLSIEVTGTDQARNVQRLVALVDVGAFLAGIALSAAAIALLEQQPSPGWVHLDSTPLLRAAVAQGLAVAELAS